MNGGLRAGGWTGFRRACRLILSGCARLLLRSSSIYRPLIRRGRTRRSYPFPCTAIGGKNASRRRGLRPRRGQAVGQDVCRDLIRPSFTEAFVPTEATGRGAGRAFRAGGVIDDGLCDALCAGREGRESGSLSYGRN